VIPFPVWWRFYLLQPEAAILTALEPVAPASFLAPAALVAAASLFAFAKKSSN
jgi:hypothetical protein